MAVLCPLLQNAPLGDRGHQRRQGAFEFGTREAGAPRERRRSAQSVGPWIGGRIRDPGVSATPGSRLGSASELCGDSGQRAAPGETARTAATGPAVASAAGCAARQARAAAPDEAAARAI